LCILKRLTRGGDKTQITVAGHGKQAWRKCGEASKKFQARELYQRRLGLRGRRLVSDRGKGCGGGWWWGEGKIKRHRGPPSSVQQEEQRKDGNIPRGGRWPIGREGNKQTHTAGEGAVIAVQAVARKGQGTSKIGRVEGFHVFGLRGREGGNQQLSMHDVAPMMGEPAKNLKCGKNGKTSRPKKTKNVPQNSPEAGRTQRGNKTRNVRDGQGRQLVLHLL